MTGEGCFDAQSLAGKVVAGVAARARAHGVPVTVIAGRVALEPARYREAGILSALPLGGSGPEGEGSDGEAATTMGANAAPAVERAARRWAAALPT